MRQQVYEALSSVADTYYLEVPVNSPLPLILFYFLNEEPGMEGDDAYADRRYVLSVDYFNPANDLTAADAVEEAIANLGGFLLLRRDSKEDGVFRFHYEFELFDIQEEVI